MAEATKTTKTKKGLIKYLSEVKGELKRVAWPSAKKTRKNTIVVIAYMIIIAVVIGVLDFCFGSVVKTIIGGFGA